MVPKHITPILNVSDITQSFAWFAKLGWRKCWDYHNDPNRPPTFGAVGCGHFEIFVCLDGQGGRGKDGGVGDEGRGVWMMIWVEDVDALYRECVAQGLETLMSPRDEPWGVREFHLRHPDGHVFRMGTAVKA